ncbi:F-box/LRR-repeat protein At3g26922-like [Punica granatum]|uniref:F-box domain-containing protein n=2 Tax=Punica granatum TaxID=22663 RepID=A0A218Y347_PUNGR|nr:F-box/LRR-repeat protein At3g26922-like [Punica granatum]OWM91259.1 hypothetical protein CDL15_Pgr000203 [Punica granatum]PKI40132.1 hypothetical protein CRG98_039504 [Punica granatum]
MEPTSVVAQAICKNLSDNQHVTHSSWLCDLPDAVLYHILSFLPMKDVVTTSILSKKWQYFWASVPNLEFCESDFSERSLFMNFVDRAFIFRDRSSIRALSLSCKVRRDAPRINAWITAAARGDLVELSLNLQDNEPITLPCRIFGSGALNKFELNSSCILRSHSSACLSSLKVVSLTRVTFVDDSSIRNLFSSPLLEELSIKHCKWMNLKSVSISAPKLMKLSIDDYDGDFLEECVSYDRQIEIDGTSLTSLFYRGELINRYCLRSAYQLVEVEISTSDHPALGVKFDLVAKNSYELLGSLSSVKSLTLSEVFLEDLGRRIQLFDAIPVLSMMTKLKVTEEYFTLVDYPAFFMLLRRSPNIHTLEFAEALDSAYTESMGEVPLCFSTQLKKIEIGTFCATSNEFSVVKALLKAATALEEMVMHVKGDNMDRDAISKKLMVLPRGLNCRIIVVPDRETQA